MEKETGASRTPTGGRSSGTIGGFWTPDHEFALAARLIPGGFGGLYYENSPEGQRLAIVLVDLGKSTEAVQAFVDAVHCGALFQGSGFTAIAASGVVVNQGQYDAGELFEWKNKAGNVPGWTMLDFDEKRNRIVVGIESEGKRSEMASKLRSAGIPEGAVVIVIA